MKVCLLLVYSVCMLVLGAGGSPVRTLEGNAVRLKRSDDPPPLETVVEQLVNRVTAEEAKSTALQAKIESLTTAKTALQAEVNTLKTKRCETGGLTLRPHGRPESGVIYHGKALNVRKHTQHVTFTHPFVSAPWVTVSLNGIDANYNVNLRVYSSFSGVSNSGFDLYAFEWSDTVLTSVDATWVACSV